ncbi:MAG: T9SS type A sorting domain-containing protein [Crocinitomix sp.]|nr:T9SS type A sorting domain-containing protein [Crocinitomix sp.]
MRKLLLTTFAISTLALSINAQNLEWAGNMGGASSDEAKSLTVDASGNTYTTGYFKDIADLDPAAATMNFTSNGEQDIYIQKLNADGELIWAKQMGGTGTDEGKSIAVDNSGNVYTTGYFEGTVDFDPNAGTTDLTAIGGSDIYIQKLNSDGDLLWVKQMGGGSLDGGNAIAVDGLGNVHTTGIFTGTIDFDPGAGSFDLGPTGFTDVFIQKLDTDGDFIWAVSMGSSSYDYGNAIFVDASSNVYSTGYFVGTVDFDPGAGDLSLTSNGGNDIYVQKLDGDGILIWAKSFGGIENDIASGIAVDGSGNTLITGYYYGTVDFDPGAGITDLTALGNTDVFVQKLDDSGDLVWVKNLGGANWEFSYDVTTDAAGNVYTVGSYDGDIDADPGAGTVNLYPVGGYDNFIHKMNADGEYVWAVSVGGDLGDLIYSIHVDASANVYASGYFSGTAEFDPGAGSTELTSTGTDLRDMFVLKMSQDIDDASVGSNDPVQFSFYPNPATTELTVVSEQKINSIIIYDLYGAIVQSENVTSFSIANLAVGIYIITVKTDQGSRQTRFVKQ